MFPVNHIRELCKEQGITLAELERKVGFGNGVISRWENAPRSPQIDSLVLIANALGCTVDDLITGKKNPATQSDGTKGDSVINERHAYVNELFDQLSFQNQIRAAIALQSLLQSQLTQDEMKESD